ncbi:glycosyltransferase family 2 protein [Enterococcus asini]|uniref:Glycosyltransferase family 2 protein n=1 Tax=Enterococcus asini TaxID=57732 RepID=A0AAW8TYC9_9ENTE|nr:glycosyltransferase family 2 protein [Enterococcus asini]MDT2811256.1 glycosyltransferase family 2 protein [Enterococcus asini]
MKSKPNEIILSVIIPFFNPGNDLEKCLKSIQNQRFKSFEVLLINDGSTDKSNLIAERYQNSDCRYKYFSTNNRGVSAARNLGIEKARGTFITFIDADDYIDEKHFSVLVENIKDSELLVTGYSEVIDDEVVSEFSLPSRVITTKDEIIDLIINNEAVKGYACNKIFKKTLIREFNIRFDEKIFFGEDLLFSISYAQHCNKCQIISEAGYFYVQPSKKNRQFDFNRLRRRMTYTDAGLKVLAIAESYPEVNSYAIKERIGRDGAFCLYQASRIQMDSEEIEKYFRLFQPFVKWRWKIPNKNYYWIKQMISIYRFLILGKLNTMKYALIKI